MLSYARVSILSEMEVRSDFISSRRVRGDGSEGIWETGRDSSSGWNWGSSWISLSWVSIVSSLDGYRDR